MSDEKPHDPSVVDHKILRTSVSGIQKFVDCPRKWYFNYVEELREPEGKGQTRGKEGHARIEHYLKTGQNTLDPLEQRGIERGLIPKPGPGLLVEHPFEGEKGKDGKPAGLQTIALKAMGVPLAGFIDLVNLRTPGLIEVVDWKFKKSIEEYGIRQKDVFNTKSEAGIQLIGYSEWARINFPERKLVKAGHVTFQTKGARDVQPVFDQRSVDSVPELWQNISERVIPEMHEAAAQTNAFKVQGNTSACHKYRGCFFLGKCYDPLQRLAAKFNERAAQAPQGGNTVGFLNLKVTSATAPTAGTSPVAPASSPVVAAGTRAFTPTPLLGIVPPDSPRNLPPPTSKITFELDGVSMDAAQARVTPLAPPSPPATAPVAVSSAEATPAAATVGATAPPIVAGGEPPKRRPGRPPKAEVAARAQIPSPATAAPVAPVLAVPPAGGSVVAGEGTSTVPPPPPASAQAPVEASPVRILPAGGGATSTLAGPAVPHLPHRLFIGCRPGGEVRDLLPYTLELQKQIIEGTQVNLPIADLRLCNDDVLGFGRWQAVLAKAVELGDLPPGAYVVTTTDARVKVVADALAALLPAEAVTRGLA